MEKRLIQPKYVHQCINIHFCPQRSVFFWVRSQSPCRPCCVPGPLPLLHGAVLTTRQILGHAGAHFGRPAVTSWPLTWMGPLAVEGDPNSHGAVGGNTHRGQGRRNHAGRGERRQRWAMLLPWREGRLLRLSAAAQEDQGPRRAFEIRPRAPHACLSIPGRGEGGGPAPAAARPPPRAPRRSPPLSPPPPPTLSPLRFSRDFHPASRSHPGFFHAWQQRRRPGGLGGDSAAGPPPARPAAPLRRGRAGSARVAGPLRRAVSQTLSQSVSQRAGGCRRPPSFPPSSRRAPRGLPCPRPPLHCRAGRAAPAEVGFVSPHTKARRRRGGTGQLEAGGKVAEGRWAAGEGPRGEDGGGVPSTSRRGAAGREGCAGREAAAAAPPGRAWCWAPSSQPLHSWREIRGVNRSSGKKKTGGGGGRSRRVPRGVMGGVGSAGPAGGAPADPRGPAGSSSAGLPPATPRAGRGCGAGEAFRVVGGATLILWWLFGGLVVFFCLFFATVGATSGPVGVGGVAGWWGRGRVVLDRKKRWKRENELKKKKKCVLYLLYSLPC